MNKSCKFSITKLASLMATSFLAINSFAAVNSVIIQGAENTKYGYDSAAAMVSSVQISAERLPKYQIAFDVILPADRNIDISSSSGTSKDASRGIITLRPMAF